MRHYKKYETYVGAKTTETFIDSFLASSVKALSMAVRIKDSDALRNELRNDYIITRELSDLSGGIALRCGPARSFERVSDHRKTWRFQR